MLKRVLLLTSLSLTPAFSQGIVDPWAFVDEATRLAQLGQSWERSTLPCPAGGGATPNFFAGCLTPFLKGFKEGDNQYKGEAFLLKEGDPRRTSMILRLDFISRTNGELEAFLSQLKGWATSNSEGLGWVLKRVGKVEVNLRIPRIRAGAENQTLCTSVAQILKEAYAKNDLPVKSEQHTSSSGLTLQVVTVKPLPIKDPPNNEVPKKEDPKKEIPKNGGSKDEVFRIGIYTFPEEEHSGDYDALIAGKVYEEGARGSQVGLLAFSKNGQWKGFYGEPFTRKVLLSIERVYSRGNRPVECQGGGK